MISLGPAGQLSHHAYCLIGGAAVHDELISALRKAYKLKTVGNPDFFDRSYGTFSIDDARELKLRHETMPVSEKGMKIFVLTMNGITVEAQNALLKLLEEPAEYAHFFLILPSAHLLLPTVKSRITFVGEAGSRKQEAGRPEIAEEAEKFLKMDPAKRIDAVKKFMEDITKEKRPKQDAIEFLDELQDLVHAKGISKNMPALESIELARKYATDRAPSLKMLLEYVALTI